MHSLFTTHKNAKINVCVFYLFPSSQITFLLHWLARTHTSLLIGCEGSSAGGVEIVGTLPTLHLNAGSFHKTSTRKCCTMFCAESKHYFLHLKLFYRIWQNFLIKILIHVFCALFEIVARKFDHIWHHSEQRFLTWLEQGITIKTASKRVQQDWLKEKHFFSQHATFVLFTI